MYTSALSFPRKILRTEENRRVLQSRSDLLTINVGIVIANARVLLCISPTGTRELASYVIYVLSSRAGIEFRVNSLPKFHRISFDVFAEYTRYNHISRSITARKSRIQLGNCTNECVPREFSKYRSFLKNNIRDLLYSSYCVM